MASRYLIPAGGTYVNAATDIWAASSGDPADGNGLNATADVAVLNHLSGNLTLAGVLTSIGLEMELYLSDKVLALDGNNMVINGWLEGFGGNGTVAGAGTITVSGINPHTIHDDATIASTVTLKFTAGSGTPTLGPVSSAFPIIGGLTVDNNNVTSFIVLPSTSGLRIAGDFIYTAGKIDFLTNNVAVRLTGTANLFGPNLSNRFSSLTIATGATITRTVETHMRKLIVEAGAELAASFINWQVRLRPVGDDYLQVLGSVTTAGIEVIEGVTDRSNSLDVSNVVLLDFRGADKTFTWTGLLDVTNLIVRGSSNALFGKLLLGASGYNLGAVLLGNSIDATRPGKIDLAATSGSITSLARANAADSNNEFDFGSSNLESSGILNFTGVAGIVDGAAYIIGGTVLNTAHKGVTGGLIYALTSIDGGNNHENVIFELAGDLLLTGVE